MKKYTIAAIALAAGLVIGGAVIRFTLTATHEKTAAQSAGAEKKERRILYYRNPMNPKVTSPVFMKDSMGMDYIPVYEDDQGTEPAPGLVRISTERQQKIGVKSAQAAMMNLKRTIRTVGSVEPIETNISVINAKVSGWVEKLYVDRTDLMVGAGEKLLELYSPELVSAQEEFLIAQKGVKEAHKGANAEAIRSAEAILNASKDRLLNWDITEDQIRRLSETGNITRTMTIIGPISGSVTEKFVVNGQKISPGEPLFKIIDHSTVWVWAEIYEYELPYVRVGDRATITSAYDAKTGYSAKVEHIYSHMGSARYTPEGSTEVRTVKIRMVLPNKDHRLKLGMYMNVEIDVDVAKHAVAIPESALIDTGTRAVVIIDNRDGTFEPRIVRPGGRADGYVEIYSGVEEDEWVVTSANFLIDSESNLTSAITSLAEDRQMPDSDSGSESRAGAHKGH